MACRETLNCTKYVPYFNAVEYQPWEFDLLEMNFLLAGFLQLLVALRTARVPTFVGVLLLGMVMETIGYVTKSHVHVEFRLQLACFLSVKEVLWYANTLFSSLIIVQELAPRGFGRVESALLVALLAILQDAPYEMTNAHAGVRAVYINKEDFLHGDLNEELNSGSSMVILSFFLVAFAAGLVSCSSTLNHSHEAIILPILTPLVLVMVMTPINIARYVGCGHLSMESDPLQFHIDCVTRESAIKTTPLLVFGFVLVLFRLIRPVPVYYRVPIDKLTLKLLFGSALLCHFTFIVHSAAFSSSVSNLIIVLSLAMAHLGLIYRLTEQQLQERRVVKTD